jgi:hypothetical protein
LIKLKDILVHIGSFRAPFVDMSAVFLILISIYLLTYSGVFRADDEHILAARAQSWAFRRQLDYPQIYGSDRVRPFALAQPEVGPPVVAIEPGQAFVGATLYQIAAAVDVGGAQAFFLLNLYATAMTGSIVYLIVRSMDFNRKVAFLTGLLYGVCTMAWPYAKTGFRDPLGTLLLSIAFLGWALFARERSWKSGLGILLIVFGMGASLAIKAIVIVALPALVISGLLLGILSRIERREELRMFFVASLIAGFFIFIGFLLPETGIFSRNSFVYYLELVNRYIEDLGSHTILAFLGPFISPAKNLLIFSPVLILIPWVIWKYWRQYAYFILPTLLTVAFLALAQALHLGELWAGTLFWGLRFMLPALPLLSVMLAPWIMSALNSSSVLTRVAGLSIIILSFLVQLAGAVVKWAFPFQYWAENGLDPIAPDAVWDFRFQVVPIHIKGMIDPFLWDIAWIQTLPVDPGVIFVPIAALFFFLIGLVFALANVSKKYPSMSVIICIVLVVTALVVPFYPTLDLLQSDPRKCNRTNDPTSAIDYVLNHVQNGDLVVVDSYGSCIWYRMMNLWKGTVSWYSLPFGVAGTTTQGLVRGGYVSAAMIQLLENSIGDRDRILYLSSTDVSFNAPTDEGEWLKNHYSSVEEIHFKDSVNTKLLIISISDE